MPTYRITSPDGRTSIAMTGDAPPSGDQIRRAFAAVSLAKGEDQPPPDSAPPLSGSALARFGENFGAQVNPVTMAKGVYQMVTDLPGTAVAIGQASWDQGRQAVDLARQGRYVEAAGHVGGAIPLIGPAAAQAGEQIASGDVAGGIGSGLGLIAMMGAPALLRGTKAAMLNNSPKIAAWLEKGAQARIVDAMTPKVGPNKLRFGTQAAKMAPDVAGTLAREGAPWTKEGLQEIIQTKLSHAEALLDEADAARQPGLTINVRPMLQDLIDRRQSFVAEASAGGVNQIPEGFQARVAQIDRAIKAVRKLGGKSGAASYDAVLRLRQGFDVKGKAVYSPSMTADYLGLRGEQLGAADAAGVLRDHLATSDPQAAAANAAYHIYRTANDVMAAAEETERVRPRVGRKIISRMTGTLLGQQAAGPVGAGLGYLAGPLIDAALMAGPTTQLKTAAMMTRLATAIRAGNVGQASSIAAQLRYALGSGLVSATNPLGSTPPAIASETP